MLGREVDGLACLVEAVAGGSFRCLDLDSSLEGGLLEHCSDGKSGGLAVKYWALYINLYILHLNYLLEPKH